MNEIRGIGRAVGTFGGGVVMAGFGFTGPQTYRAFGYVGLAMVLLGGGLVFRRLN